MLMLAIVECNSSTAACRHALRLARLLQRRTLPAWTRTFLGEVIVVFPSPFWKIRAYYIKLGHGRFLPHPTGAFVIIIQCYVFEVTDNVVK